MKINLIKKSPKGIYYNDIREFALKLFEAETPKEERPEEKRKIKPVFPMDYIMYKFPQFKSVLTELLTVTYKNYVKNIYVVAPKPTTFKVVLKNEQDFTITYDERSYIVKVQGKKYYLLNIGEKQRATQAIADLLGTKKFISTKEIGEEETEPVDSAPSGGGGSGGGGTFPGEDNLDLPAAGSSPDGGVGGAGGEDELTGDDLDALIGGDTGGGDNEEPDTDEPPLAENTILRVVRPLK